MNSISTVKMQVYVSKIELEKAEGNYYKYKLKN